MKPRLQSWLATGLLSVLSPLMVAADEPSVAQPIASDAALIKTLERALPYLQEEGRAWMDGQVDIQDGSNCVSCHQVPSGIWSQELAYRALEQDRPAELTRLIDDAADFISDPTIGRAAMWSQLLVVINSANESTTGPMSETTADLARDWKEPILDSQQANGGWLAQGQFPSQLRPIEESDAVVTMWMLAGLRRYRRDDPDIEDAIAQALRYIDASTGKSTEWIAWKSITDATTPVEQASGYAEKLVQQQNADGGWGWTRDAQSDPYSTGVALFALVVLNRSDEPQREARQAATSFLIETQREDGTWEAPSRLFTKTGSKSRDYVYQYWGSAWATLGLATELSSRNSDHGSDSNE